MKQGDLGDLASQQKQFKLDLVIYKTECGGKVEISYD